MTVIESLDTRIALSIDERTLDLLERRQRSSIVRRGWLVRRALLAADLIGLTGALLIAEFVLPVGTTAPNRFDQWIEVSLFLVSLPVWVVMAKLYGLYDRDEEQTNYSTADDFVGVFHMVTVGTWVVFVVLTVTRLSHPSLEKVATFWIVAVVLVAAARAVARMFCRTQVAYLQNTVIVGAGDVGQTIARKYLRHPEYGINLVGFVDAQPKEHRDDLDDLTILGDTSDLREIVRMLDVDRVVIAFSNESHTETLDLIRSLKDLNVQIDIVPRLFDIVGPGVGMHTVEGLPLLGISPPRLPRSSLLLKRSMDLIASVVGLLVLAPVFAVIALAIVFDSPGPVFFRQVRMGERNRRFRIWKFRTMGADAEERKPELAHLNAHAQHGGDSRMFKIPADPRMTRVGGFLRRYSLDELPQLLNVVRGEMSLVGPRPLILAEDQHVHKWARERLNLRPGITGPWQVLGRSGIPFEEMVRLDYLYVTGWSLFGDLKLILRTVPLVFAPRATT
jgi:exopolysaccharide biosynthesis polyprenyl glycosylphosphotransferase